MTTLTQKAQDFSGVRESILKSLLTQDKALRQFRLGLWRGQIMREYTRNPLKRLLRKILAYQNKRRLLKTLRKFQNMTPIGYNMVFQCMDELEETGEVQVKYNMKEFNMKAPPSCLSSDSSQSPRS